MAKKKTSIEDLESYLDVIRKDNDALTEMLEFRGLSPHCSETMGLIKIYLPKMESSCRELIYMCREFTERVGHSRRLDFVKNVTFGILGRCVGEDLTENLNQGE